jgi:RHS repeat-associated protein
MLVPNRHDSLEDYRYGFQGQEKDDEIKGEGNSLNYTFRMHDPRVGRFFAVDPLEKKYPWNSTYAFSENMVIQFNELEGLEVGTPQFYAKHGFFGETAQKVVTAVEDETVNLVTSTYKFVTKDAWSKETWKGLWSVYTEVADAASYGHSTRRPTPTPALDAMANDFDKNVIKGDTYSRTRFATALLYSIIGTKGTDKLVKISAISKVVERFSKTVNMYRVQGGVGKNASRFRFVIKDGDISIAGKDMLYVTFNDKERALTFLAKRGEEAYLIEVKVSKKFADKIKNEAVDQVDGKANPGKPQRVDQTKTDSSYGLPEEYFDSLLNEIKEVKTTNAK